MWSTGVRMAYLKQFWSLAFCMIFVQQRSWARHFLYYASPGDGSRPPGLWGGFIDFRNDGSASDLHQSNHLCVAMKGDKYYTELELQGMSHDPKTSQVILELENEPDTSSAFIAPVCYDVNSCDEDINDVFFSLVENEDDLQPAKLGPYALWNDSIYFVARRFVAGLRERSRIMRMEIRRLVGCDHMFPFTARNSFNLDECSDLVSLIVEETSERVVLAMRETLKPSDHLYVLERQERLVFLLQIYNYTFEDAVLVEYSMHLMAATAGVLTPATELHTEQLPLKYTWHILGQLGGISSLEDVLCWTATDRILCAYWSDRGLVNVQTVLPAGRGSRVCTGTSTHPIYANVTSGVVIADVSKDGLALYFGCYAARSGVGGAGLLKVSPDWGPYQLFPLRDRDGPIYAGSMFLTDHCDALYDYELNSPVPWQDPTTPYTLRDDPNSGQQNPSYEVDPVSTDAAAHSSRYPVVVILLVCICLMVF